MNTDDPKFTAHVLGENEDLTPAEVAEIEALLAHDPTAKGEAAETGALAARLRAELPGEKAAALREEQRAAVLDAVAHRDARPKIVRFPRRVLALTAIAACVIVAVSAALLYRALQLEKAATRKSLAARSHPASQDDSLPAASIDEGTPGEEIQTIAPPDRPPLLTGIPGVTPAPFTDGSFTAARPVLLAGTNSPAKVPMLAPVAHPAVPPAPSSAGSTTPGARQQPQPVSIADSTADISGAPSAAIPPHGPVTALTALNGQPQVHSERNGRWENAAGISPAGSMVTLTAGVATVDLPRDFPFVKQGRWDPSNTAAYGGIVESNFMAVRENPLSTFSIDVDTASYSIVRRFLNDGQLPPQDAVRIEELLNYFTYDYPPPKGEAPFAATMEVAGCPWQPEHRLVRIGLKGRELARDHRPPSNLVFLIDVSGSMDMPNKLPLLKQCFGLLIDQLGPEDQVSIVTYAGESGCALEPTHDKQKMREAMRQLEAGGSTNGASGLQMAYQIARKSFIKGGTNRIILATDGDWNVGVTNEDDLLALIADKTKTGVFLTALGFGVDNLKDRMLVKLADRGNGHYAYIDTLLEAKKVFVEQLTDTLVNIAKDVKIQVEFNPARVSAYRLIGYEKRALAKEDFNDDRKDAGEIGAGHTVTALYEIVPAGQEPPAPRVDPLKYQPQPKVETAAVPQPPTGETSNELLTLKVRYKAPDGDASRLLEFPLMDAGALWEKSSRDFHFAAAVAGYGMLLRDSSFKGNATWDSVSAWAREGLGADPSGYRAEFISLLEKARELAH